MLCLWDRGLAFHCTGTDFGLIFHSTSISPSITSIEIDLIKFHIVQYPILFVLIQAVLQSAIIILFEAHMRNNIITQHVIKCIINHTLHKGLIPIIFFFFFGINLKHQCIICFISLLLLHVIINSKSIKFIF